MILFCSLFTFFSGRLEFLSELPERLEKMIDQGMYKAAIQLYNKTLSVLKKQSHVLSFKKIQERTESMMIELRAKVLSLFDSQSLDTQQLTEYVDTLRMMGCPRDLIIEKFLAAHKYRFGVSHPCSPINCFIDHSK